MRSILVLLFFLFYALLFSQGQKGNFAPGEIVTIQWQNPGSIIDGYTLYVPEKYAFTRQPFPLILFLQGGSTVG